MQAQPSHLLRAAGALYLVIIATGLTGELALRGPLLGATPEDTATALATGETLLRLSVLADALMISADVALAILLFAILAPVGRLLASLAAAFRLIQAAILGAGLTTLFSALVWSGAGQPEMAHSALFLHATGYDLGLIFFGISSVVTSLLLIRHPDFPAWLGAMVGAAGLVYLTGSTLRITLPEAYLLFQPAYLGAVVAETAFAVTLLAKGLPRRSGSQTRLA
jgi:hypothetical protein